MDPPVFKQSDLSSMAKVRFTIPIKGIDAQIYISQFQQLEKHIRGFQKQYGDRFVPYYINKNKYFNFAKHKDKVRTLLQNQKNKREITITSSSNVEYVNLGSEPIRIQFIYKKGYENQKLQQQLNRVIKKVEKLNQKIQSKISDESQSYYNAVRNFKIINSSHSENKQMFKTIKICFLLSEPLVSKAQSKSTSKSTSEPIFKEEVDYRKHMKKIEQIHSHYKTSIDIIFQRVYMNKYSLDKFIQQSNQDKSIDYIILHIYVELHQQSPGCFKISLQSDTEIGLEANKIKLSNFMSTLNKLNKLYFIMLIGPNMRKLRVYHQKKQKQNLPKQKQTIKQQKQGIQQQNQNDQQALQSSVIQQQAIFYEQVRVPVITFGTYDVNIDPDLMQYILQILYQVILNRKSIVKEYKGSLNKIKQFFHYFNTNHKEKSLHECFCMYWNNPLPQLYMSESKKQLTQADYNKRKRIINFLGLSAYHRLFLHDSTLDTYAQECRRKFVETLKIMNLIWKLFFKDDNTQDQNNYIKDHNANEYEYSKNRITFGGDVLLFFSEKPTQFNKIHSTNSQNIYVYQQSYHQIDAIPTNLGSVGTVRYKNNFIDEEIIIQKKRPKVLFDFIKLITSTQKVQKCKNIIAVIGNPKSGKSQLINQAFHYIKNRKFAKKKYVCINNKNWLKDFNQKAFIKNTQNKYQQIVKQKQKQLSIKLMINLGKINYEVAKNQFKQFIDYLLKQNFFSKYPNIFIIYSCSKTQQLQKQQLSVFQITSIESLREKLYIILKNKYLRFTKFNQVRMFFKFIQAIKNSVGNIQQKQLYGYFLSIDFANKINELSNSYNLQMTKITKKASGSFGEKMEIIQAVFLEKQKQYYQKIKKQLISQQSKINPTLRDLQSKNKDLWSDLGFLCSFKKGFSIFKFNKLIAIENRQNQQQIKKLQNLNVRLFRVYQNQYFKEFSIQAQTKCYEYFYQKQVCYLDRKIKYLFNFYLKLYLIIRNDINKNTESLYQKTRSIQRKGLFMYDADVFMQTLPRSQKQEEYLCKKQIQLQSQQKNEQKKKLYSIVINKHVQRMLDFMRSINQKFQNKQNAKNINLTKLFCSFWLVFMCHATIKIDSNQQFQYLTKQIKKFMIKNLPFFINTEQFKSNQQQMIIIIYQIFLQLNQFQNIVNILLQPINDSKIVVLKKILNNLTRFEQYRREVTLSFQKLQQLYIQIKQGNLKNNTQKNPKWTQFLKNINDNVRFIDHAIKCIDQNIQKSKQIRIDRYKHLQCKLEMFSMKVRLKFNFFNYSINQTESPGLQSKILKEQITKLTKQLTEFSELANDNILKVCEMYLNIKTQFQNTQIEDSSEISNRKVPNEFRNLIQYVKQKLNPKRLFKKKNMIVFMKASCLKIQQTDYSFVRMGNIISSFVQQQLKYKLANLYFMNLSDKNFQEMSRENPSNINTLVLSIDCVKVPTKDHKQELYLVFEKGRQVSDTLISAKTFVNWLQKIKFKVLILFGAKSNELKNYISYNIQKHIQNSCIIALHFPDKLFNLSTRPLGEQTSQIIQNFIKMENSQRCMEMTLCSIIYFLSRNQTKFDDLNQGNIDWVIRISIANSQKVIQRWYENNKIHVNFYRIKYDYYIKNKMRWPEIPQGKINNLTAELIFKNFTDDKYYENIGKNSVIKKILYLLSHRQQKDICIEIIGDLNSGKTTILQQIGWFCHSRRIFLSGVHKHDASEFPIEKNKQKLKQLTKIQYTSEKRFLILIDNLDILMNFDMQFLIDFFQNLKNKHISLVFTVDSSNKKKLTAELESKMKQSINIGFSNYKKFHGEDINKLTKLQKICIILTNLRNQSKKSYVQLFKQYFPLQMGDIVENIKEKDEYQRIQKNMNNGKKKIVSKSSNQTKSVSSNKQNKTLQKISQVNTSRYEESIKQQHSKQQQQQPFIFNNFSKQLQFANNLQQSEDYEQFAKGIYRSQTIEANPHSQVPGLFSRLSCPLNQITLSGDVGSLMKKCQQIKEKQKIDFTQSYLEFDIQNLTKLLESMNKNKVDIVNELFF